MPSTQLLPFGADLPTTNVAIVHTLSLTKNKNIAHAQPVSFKVQPELGVLSLVKNITATPGGFYKRKVSL